MQKRKLYINDILCDLPNDVEFAITFQVNDLADLKDRQSTYTNTIRLPKTGNNARALGYAATDAFTQLQPYRFNPAKYVENGIELLPFAQAKVLQVTDFYEVQLTYGIVGLNDVLGDKKLTDLDFSGYTQYSNSLADIADSNAADKGYMWPTISVNNNITIASVTLTRYSRPAFFTKSIIEQISKLTGYRFLGDVFFDTLFQSELITKLDAVQPTAPSAADNLPDFTLKEFLKDFMQRYFLTPEVYNYAKIVRFRSFDELYTNKPLAKDWTYKFIDDAVTNEFTIGDYAQSNKLNFDPYVPQKTTFDDYKDDFVGYINIDNTTLEPEKELLTSIFSGAHDKLGVLGGALQVANLDIADPNESDNPGVLLQENKPLVLYSKLATTSGVFQYFQDIGTSTFRNYIRVAYFNDMTYTSLINKRATGLQKMLLKARVVTKYVLLNSVDLQDFDFFIPVYDAREAKYYYVNKIVNYIPGRKTKVQLIRL